MFSVNKTKTHYTALHFIEWKCSLFALIRIPIHTQKKKRKKLHFSSLFANWKQIFSKIHTHSWKKIAITKTCSIFHVCNWNRPHRGTIFLFWRVKNRHLSNEPEAAALKKVIFTTGYKAGSCIKYIHTFF